MFLFSRISALANVSDSTKAGAVNWAITSGQRWSMPLSAASPGRDSPNRAPVMASSIMMRSSFVTPCLSW